MADIGAGGGYRPQVAETHTGLVVLVGDRAYKMKKPVVTDFLDFSTLESRERACAHEVMLNQRLSPETYLGVAHFVGPDGGDPEPVIVMRRYSDEVRLATKVRRGEPVESDLAAIAAILARFHADADRSRQIDEQAVVGAVTGRWRDNITELARYADGRIPGLEPAAVAEIDRLVNDFVAGRAVLFAGRITSRRIVDGHADLLADDIFCLPGGPALLDCLEFDDHLRYVDVIDDVAFLAMDLEFLGRGDLAEEFMRRYLASTGDDAPASLRHFYTAYRAGVRAKVDCVRYLQGRGESADDACRHLDIAGRHLRAAGVRLILVGGGPGTGKSTLARALAERLEAQVISSDDVRADMVSRGELTGAPGVLGEGLYARGNIDAVYDALLREARLGLCGGRTVILDATWHDPRHRQQAREVAAAVTAGVSELACVAPLDATVERIRSRTATTSQVTPEIAAALAAADDGTWAGAKVLDTTKPLSVSVAAAENSCRPSN
jgi:aminoglycoside phosphotransferase family enzyme/predicted kinase